MVGFYQSSFFITVHYETLYHVIQSTYVCGVINQTQNYKLLKMERNTLKKLGFSLKTYVLSLVLLVSTAAFAQTKSEISGKILDGGNQKTLASATVCLLKAKDSSIVKMNLADGEGNYSFEGIASGDFLVSVTVTGYKKAYSGHFTVNNGDPKALETIQLIKAEKALAGVTVVSKKPLIERKADRVIFNVENSINATGSNALELLQKSPGVVVDNNENITMKGKSGVKIYIDGKMSQLDAKDLADYLKSINSNDIEAIEMISNPGAKYDASGNAGIINIKLKKNKKFGTNGSASLGYTQGITPKGDGSFGLNYRDKKVNIFSNVSGSIGNRSNQLSIYRIQSDSIYDQHTSMLHDRKSANIKAGIDYFKDKKNTFGFLVTANFSGGSFNTDGNTNIYSQPGTVFVKQLQASNTSPTNRTNANFNVNYRYADTSGKEIGFDGDYGLFRSTGTSYQPNFYYDGGKNLLQSNITGNSTPTDINIYTAKLDVEQKFMKGKIGYGAKFADVKTNNALDFFNYQNGVAVKSLPQSNQFVYIENVNAAYVNYNREFNPKWTLQAGLRAEQTNSKGVLTRADGMIQSDNTVKRSYFDLFPSAALSYTVNAKNSFGITYSRRIDRPDYQDLNPFENKLDELTYQKGNAFLKPQYTDNVELSHTFKSKLNTTVGYSYVKDYATQITDTTNGNATFVQQQNIATQRILNLNISSPLSFTKWWTGYANIWYNYQLVKGEYNQKTVSLKAPGYGAYMQNSFSLGKDYKAEISGWYNGPGLEGTWKRGALYSMDLGVQKQILKSKATIKVNVNDVFNSIKFNASSNYGGTKLNIHETHDSRNVHVAFTYRFGSSQIKGARQHKTGLEAEGNRIK